MMTTGRVELDTRGQLRLATLTFLVAVTESWLSTRGMLLPVAHLAPAMLLAGLFAVPRRDLACYLGAGMALQLAAFSAAGMPVTAATMAALGIGAQALAGALFLRLRLPGEVDLTRLRPLLDLCLAALLVTPPVGYGVSLLISHLSAGNDPRLTGIMRQMAAGLPVAEHWILPTALGILLVVPMVLAAIQRGIANPWRWFNRKRVALFAIMLALHGAAFSQTNAFLLFLVMPGLVAISIRLGIRDTLLAMAISMMISASATAQGIGPIAANCPQGGQAAMLLVLYMCGLICTLPVAATLERTRRLENSLAKSTRFTDQILRNMHEVVFRTDLSGRWTFLNPAWFDITGYPVSECIGQPIDELFDAASHKSIGKALHHLNAGESDELSLMLMLIRRDGEPREFEMTIRLLRHGDGTAAGAGGIMRDVTEAMRHLRALESSESRFRELCDMAPVGILHTDLAGRITYVNWMLELTALAAREQLMGSPLADWLAGETGLDPRTLDRRLNMPGARIEREVQLQDGAGRTRWLTVVLTSDFDELGTRLGYVGAVADITSRKQAEIALAEKSSELSSLAENITDVVFRLSLDGVCRYVTPSVRELVGLPPEQVIGARPLDAIHPEDAAHVHAAFDRLARGQVNFVSVSHRVRAKGEESAWRWHEANCRLLRDGAGQPMEVVASVRDITLRKQLEIDLIDARKRAEQAAAAKSAFLANISHEIRTPMNGVIGLTELLLEGRLDKTSRHYAKLIAESGATMMQLLNDVLDLAKIEAGRLSLSTEPVDIRDLLSSSLALMTASAARKGLEIRLDVASDVPAVLSGDRLRLRQMLANLIGNAVKFTDEGHIALTARIEPSADGARALVIDVADTGIGIPEEAMKRVFEEFMQVAPGAKNGHGRNGTGLGLSITRQLAQAMGGSLELVSAVGKGTTVSLRLPGTFLADRRRAARPRKKAPLPTGTGARPLHVLVAEDNRTNQIIAAGMLGRLGHRHALAANGAEALTLVAEAEARGDPFDIVLMDMQMPVMDGLEATRQMRAQGIGPDRLPIVAVTANAFAEDVAQCLDAGMQAHLAKPLQLADLAGALALGDMAPAARPPARKRRNAAPAAS